MIWDLAFGTYFNEARRPPAIIGIREGHAARLADQLVWLFRQAARRDRMRARRSVAGCEVEQ